MDLKNLIANTDFDSPFLFWQGVTRESVVTYLHNILISEINLGKTFYYTKNNKIILIFQIQNSPWDTDHFGYKCSNIKHLYIDEKVTYKESDEIIKKIRPSFIEYLRDEKIKFIFADVSARNSINSHFIQSLGFRFILNWIEGIHFLGQLKTFDPQISVSEITAEEIKIFSKLASDSYYKEGRFYLDKRFDVKKVNSMYGNLIKNSFISGDIVLTCKVGNVPIGIFIYKKIRLYKEFKNLKEATLRFFLVNPIYRNNSYGYNIFLATLQYLSGKSDIISTGLETHNFLSLNLHWKVGFKMTYSHNAFHFWCE